MNTVSDVIAAFGGTAKTAKIFRVGPSAVSNWKASQRFPARLHWRIAREAERRGVKIDVSLFDYSDAPVADK